VKRPFILIPVTAFVFFSLNLLGANERRIVPVDWRSCGPAQDEKSTARLLWDKKADTGHKWCCFHAGYREPQIHWVIMDLGAEYGISRIRIVHDGSQQKQRHLLTEDYTILGSKYSMDGPWTPMKVVKDNTKQVNDFRFEGMRFRYVGLEVTDPQLGPQPNGVQDDWAVRIQELSIFTSDPESAVRARPFPDPFRVSSGGKVSRSVYQNTSRTITPERQQSIRYPVRNRTVFPRKKLYYFYNPDFECCCEMHKVILLEPVQQAMGKYRFENILSTARDPHIRQFNIIAIPTMIIADEADHVLKCRTGYMNQEEMLEFLK